MPGNHLDMPADRHALWHAIMDSIEQLISRQPRELPAVGVLSGTAGGTAYSVVRLYVGCSMTAGTNWVTLEAEGDSVRLGIKRLLDEHDQSRACHCTDDLRRRYELEVYGPQEAPAC